MRRTTGREKLMTRRRCRMMTSRLGMRMRSQRRRGWQKGSEQGFDEDESADHSFMFFFCA